MGDASLVVFAGGGTGGHIYPNLAVWERVQAMAAARGVGVEARFLVSGRAVDARVMAETAVAWTALPVQPLTMKPWRWLGFWGAWRRSVGMVRSLLAEGGVSAVVGTGGFVSGPAFSGAKGMGVASAMVNLDAVAGKANRAMASRVDKVFSVYAWDGAERVGLPLGARSIGPAEVAEARRMLGVDPVSEVLLIVGGSSGAESVNRMMERLIELREVREVLLGWQIVHLCGPRDEARLSEAYRSAKLSAKVWPYCEQMGAAWRGATVAISRAGAGSVAEAWANGCPAIYLPYPFHRDEHQRLNAQPVVDAGGGVLVRDVVDADANARTVAGPLLEMMTDRAKREGMIEALRRTRAENGADVVARWVMEQVEG